MPSSETTSRYRWLICSLLFWATTINYLDRQILSLLKPMLDHQLGWSNAQFGAVNSVFQGAYGVSLFVFGWIIDRYGTRRGYALSISAWSIAAICHAFVNSISGFFGARILLGLGEGGNFPAAIKATAQWFPRKERALATSLFNSGANIGAVIAPMVVPPVADAFGWHAAFVLAGLAGFVWVAAWLPLFAEPRESRRVSAAELAYIEADKQAGDDGPFEKVTWGRVLKHREAWAFVVAKFVTDPIWWFFLTWLPDFFKKTRGLDIKGSALMLASIYGVVTVLSIAGGWLTGHLMKMGWSVSRARKTGLMVFACMVLPLMLVSSSSNWTAVLLIGLAGAGHQAWSANLYTSVSDIFPKRAVATLTGIGGAAGALGGMLFPVIVGLILDHMKAGGYTLIFGFCSVAYLIALGLHSLLAPSFEPVEFD